MKFMKKLVACVIVSAMILAGVGAYLENGTLVSAASKKATVKLNKTSVTLSKGGKFTLKVVKKNVKSLKTVSWTSKNKSIATVSKSGVVKGVKAGKTTVICKVKYQATGKKKYQSKSLKATVKVKAAGTPQAPTNAPVGTDAPMETKVPESPSPSEKPDNSPTPANPDQTPAVEPTPTVAPTPTPAATNNQAKDMAEKLGAGINIGNSLDSFNDSGYISGSAGLNYETSWGCPKVTKTLIDGIKAAGFTTVRIPVSYVNHVKTEKDANGNKIYTIDEQWMSRVKEVVDMAMNADLYVIINIHHDGADTASGDTLTEINGEQLSWLSPLNNSGDAYTQMEAKFTSLWTQIATQFKDYSEKLLFADMNEFHHGYNAPSTSWTNTQNKLHQAFVDTVRSTGGNNNSRYLIVPGYNTNIDYTVNYLKVPTDIVENQSTYNGNTVGHIIVEVHYYDPYTYAADNPSDSVWGSGSGSATTWANESYLEGQMKKLKTKYTDKGIPVILGEFGAPEHSSIDSATDSKYRTYFHACVVKNAAINGVVPIVWDNGTSFSYINRNTGAVTDSSVLDAIINYTKNPSAAISVPW